MMLSPLQLSTTAQLHLLSRAVASANHGITIADARLPDMPLVYVNAAFLRMTGYAMPEVLGKSCRFLQGTDRDQPGLVMLRAAIAAREEAVVLIRNYRKSGEAFWNELLLSPVLDDAGQLTHYIGIQYDVSAREDAKFHIGQLNIELERKGAELQDANVDLVAYSHSVSHDLRGPLMTISGFAGILERKLAAAGAQAETERSYAARIVDGVSQMNRLIDAMLDMATASSRPLRLAPCDVSAMARELLENYAARDPARKVAARVQDNMQAHADAPLLERVLDNLLSNAWKFTRKTEAAVIELACDKDTEGRTAFHVKDNGAGFDMAGADQLFKTFSRLHPASEFEGSGIGLHLASRIVGRHGGRIWAHSAQGRETTFSFTLG